MPTSIGDIELWRVPKEPVLSTDVALPTTQNIVGHCSVNAEAPLWRYVALLALAGYRTDKLSAVTLRVALRFVLTNYSAMRLPTAQLFESGKWVLMGAAIEAGVMYAVHTIRLLLHWNGLRAKNGAPLTMSRVFINNRVSTGAYPRPLDIKNFEPEDNLNTVEHRGSFPGITRQGRFPGSRKTFTFGIFDSGRFNVTGYNAHTDWRAIWHMDRVFSRNRDDVRRLNYATPVMNEMRRALHQMQTFPRPCCQWILDFMHRERARIDAAYTLTPAETINVLVSALIEDEAEGDADDQFMEVAQEIGALCI